MFKGQNIQTYILDLRHENTNDQKTICSRMWIQEKTDFSSHSYVIYNRNDIMKQFTCNLPLTL